jgi:hypothetical protein
VTRTEPEDVVDLRLAGIQRCLRDLELLDRFHRVVERTLDEWIDEADLVVRCIVDEVRAGTWSRAELAAFARAIAAAIDNADRLIGKARKGQEANLRDVEHWKRMSAKAHAHGATNLADHANERIAESRANAETSNDVRREYITLREQLYELGRAVLDRAARA